MNGFETKTPFYIIDHNPHLKFPVRSSLCVHIRPKFAKFFSLIMRICGGTHIVLFEPYTNLTYYSIASIVTTAALF